MEQKCKHILLITAGVLLRLPVSESCLRYNKLPMTYLRGRAFAHGAMGRRIDPSWGGPIELFLVPASAPRLV